jgi:hypothetical protein
MSKFDFSGSLQTPKVCGGNFRRKVFFLPVFSVISKLKKGAGVSGCEGEGKGKGL